MHALPLAQSPSPSELASGLARAEGFVWLDGDGVHRDGRLSFLGIEPSARIEVALSEPDPLRAFERIEAATAATDSAAARLAEFGLTPGEIPYFIGYVAYDAGLAGCARRIARPSTRPALSFARYDALYVFDHVQQRALVVGDDRARCEQLRARIATLQPSPLKAHVGSVRVTPAEQHQVAIARALAHIAAGDVYQVNLARCFSASFEGDPLALFLAMRSASPVPFGFYAKHGARVLLACTMERFLRWDRPARRLCTRPIKGTIARRGGYDAEEAAALRADEKERAEHAMIVDLMRNDFGRIAEVGSVKLESLLAVEPYAALSHLVSTVVCRTRAATGLYDVLAATFPPGSVTGTPKLRAIELIEELERVPRDVYTGAVGFVDRAGGLSLAVAIRTALVESGEVRYFAGGGIVEASRPEHEVAETELKARVFLDALGRLSTEECALDLSSTEVLR